MKIYASRKNLTLDQFVGKDIWIKIKCLKKLTFHNTYIRVLDIDDNGIVTFNKILAFWVNNGHLGAKTLGAIINDQYHCELDKIILAEPIETLTTEDLLDMFEE